MRQNEKQTVKQIFKILTNFLNLASAAELSRLLDLL